MNTREKKYHTTYFGFVPNKNKSTIKKTNEEKKNNYKILKKDEFTQTVPSISAYLYSNMLTDVNNKLQNIYNK
jgi:hypothetical protein